MASYFLRVFFRTHESLLTMRNLGQTGSHLLHLGRSLGSGDTMSDLYFRWTAKMHYCPGRGHQKSNIPTAGKHRDTPAGEGQRSPALHFNPSSVFTAGAAKKRAQSQRGREEVEDEAGSRATEGRLQTPDRPLTPDEWKYLRESYGNLKHFDIAMMEQLITSKADLRVAKSLLTFVATETGTLSYTLLLRYLVLCVNLGHDDEVSDVYNIMRSNFSGLETGAASLFIRSFSRTGNWRVALSLLQEVKQIFRASTRNYSDVIAALMTHGQLTSAWNLYQELIQNGQAPFQETWSSLFQLVEEDSKGETMSHQEQHQRLLGILHYMRDNQIYPQEQLAGSIKSWFESLPGQKWTGHWTSVHPQGSCRCCGSTLESIHLTAEEFQQLRDQVMTDVIQGRDIFTKTTPKELELFKEFVKQRPPFDVVVDGLNVANSNVGKSKQSNTLLAVVSELQRQGLSILVLGRKHMLQRSRAWDTQHMKQIRQKAHCFFTENISMDDPFLLYATLHSGAHSRFVSKDLMRDHKACLQDQAMRRVFFKWQRGHQLVLDGCIGDRSMVRFKSVYSYDTIVQTGGDSWHIPYDNNQDRASYEVPQRFHEIRHGLQNQVKAVPAVREWAQFTALSAVNCARLNVGRDWISSPRSLTMASWDRLNLN